MATKEAQPLEPQPELVELIQKGNVLIFPDLTDPNTQDPNDAVLSFTNQPSGLINTIEFFDSLTPDQFSSMAPDSVVESYAILHQQIISSEDASPVDVFLHNSNYKHFLRFSIFMTTGKVMSDQDALLHIKSTKPLNLSPEDKLVTVPAAIIGFSVTNKSGGKDGTNSILDYQLFLKQLTSGDTNGTFSPLCAMYGSQVQSDGTIFAHGLLENIAHNHIQRTMRWQHMLTFIHQIKHGNLNQIWGIIAGDEHHIHSIVPKVLKQFAQNDQVAEMLMLLDRHHFQLNSLASENNLPIHTTSLEAIENQTENLLIELFGKDWTEINQNQLDRIIYQLEEDEPSLDPPDKLKLQIARIAFYHAYPGMARFAGQHQITAEMFKQKAQDLNDDLANLTSEQLSEWAQYRNFTKPEDYTTFLANIRQKLINQGNITVAADAIHEVILYFTMGAYAAKENLLVIGLDIDHDAWMTTSWKFGYNYQKQQKQDKPVPILYARNPNTGKTDGQHAGLDYAQVYYLSRQRNEDGIQPLSAMPLREYYAL